ncbi:hypothetical protein [Aliiglaciecola lipolytica]|uniref:Uncharacterized protein n=1 Tax=Aliiglaciecola lipolytica E3 TaxID=1127673 RepID=K6X773_9ALTE|nr:hypothetical protein [Aliiglaciecola lipolytica]GAC16454.1 hypothetical protein GLIP_3843 [Aliiglaciecola lipolytica E3]
MRNFRNCLRSLAALWLLSLLAMQAHAQSITVDAKNVKQQILMMGGDMERSGSNLQNAANQEEIID